MCILLYLKLIWCSGITQGYINWRRGPWYMSILLYLKLIWCSGITQIHGQLEEGDASAMGICAFFYM